MGEVEDKAREVFGERAAFYLDSACHTEAAVLDRVVAWSLAEPHWRALDIATGTGHTALALAPHVAEVVGIDITPQMLNLARALAEGRGVMNVTFEVADAHALPYQDASFELVTCRRAPHHFADLGKALAEMRRVLRPGGRLVIDDRSGPSHDPLHDLMNELDRLHDGSHVRQHRPEEWKALLSEAGFVVDRVAEYERLRPLTALTDGVQPERIARIAALIDGLDAAARKTMGVQDVEGIRHTLHWYATLSATRP